MRPPSSTQARPRPARLLRIAAYGLLVASHGFCRVAAAEPAPAVARGQTRVTTRTLLLGNGMRVYLLHDPDAKQSAAAAAVQAGAWQDPPDAPGMAHFVEHLLFMGSRAFPDEDDFYAYLARHGGNTNAYTTVDRTVYMFDADPDALWGSLQRFAAMFAHPLLRDASIARERQAVDEECRAKSQSDAWRETMVDAALSAAAHPNHHFYLGSAQSLAQVDHGAMQAWFEAHYSAHQMAVVVRGPQTLDVLQTAAEAAFGATPRRATDLDLSARPLFDAAYAGRLVAIAPLQSATREMSVRWDLPPALGPEAFDRACQLLAYLLENQGKNALLTRLRAAEWASDIDVMPRHFANGRTLLTVTLELTDAGVAQRNTVLAWLFAALRHFDDFAALQPLADELSQQTWRAWAYQAPLSGYDAVASMADALLTQEHVDFPPTSLRPVDAAHWHALLADLSLASARITLIAPDAFAKVGTGMSGLEPQMQVPYRIVAAPQALPAMAAAGEMMDEAAGNLGVPKTNPWMPQHLDVKAPWQNMPTLEAPLHLVNDAYASIYVARDAGARTPRIGITVDILVPFAQPGDAPAAALYDLWWQAVDASLADLRAQADAAGLRMQVQPTEGGIQVKIIGFAERAPQLLDATLLRLVTLDRQVTDASFDIWRTRLARIYADARRAKAERLGYQALFDWRMQRSFSIPQKQAALANLAAQDVSRLSVQMFSRAYTQGSLFGNVDMPAALGCAASVRHFLAHAPYAQALMPAPNPRTLTGGMEAQHLLVPNPGGAGSAVLVQLCEGDDTPESKAASAVLGQAIEPQFFDVLRTQQQLAYSLHTSGTSRDGQLFRTFVISPSRLGASSVAARLEAFLQQFTHRLDADGVGEEAFKAYKATLFRQWGAATQEPGPGCERLHWLAFARKGDFTLVRRRLDALERLDYATFLRYAHQALATPQRVEVWVEKTP